MQKEAILQRYLDYTLRDIKDRMSSYCRSYYEYLQGKIGQNELYEVQNNRSLIPEDIKRWAEYFCECDIEILNGHNDQSMEIGPQIWLYLCEITKNTSYRCKCKHGQLVTSKIGKKQRPLPQRIASRLLNRIFLYYCPPEPESHFIHSYKQVENMLWVMADIASSARRKGVLELLTSSLQHVSLREGNSYWLLGIYLSLFTDGCQLDVNYFERQVIRFRREWQRLGSVSNHEKMMGKLVQRFVIDFMNKREKEFFEESAAILPEKSRNQLLEFVLRVIPRSVSNEGYYRTGRGGICDYM